MSVFQDSLSVFQDINAEPVQNGNGRRRSVAAVDLDTIDRLSRMLRRAVIDVKTNHGVTQSKPAYRDALAEARTYALRIASAARHVAAALTRYGPLSEAEAKELETIVEAAWISVADLVDAIPSTPSH